MERIAVIGGGGHAKVLISVLKKLQFELVGYTDKQDRGAILGLPFLGDDGVLPGLMRAGGVHRAVIGLGKIDTSDARLRLGEEIEVLGFDSPVIVSPQALVNEEVELGPGTVVFDGAVVNSGTVIGRLCIVNTNSTVEHDCRLGDNVHIAPGATLSGGVIVGNNCTVGAGATVVQEVTICADCLIGAGSTVVDNIGTSGTYAGNPARKIA